MSNSDSENERIDYDDDDGLEEAQLQVIMNGEDNPIDIEAFMTRGQPLLPHQRLSGILTTPRGNIVISHEDVVALIQHTQQRRVDLVRDPQSQARPSWQVIPQATTSSQSTQGQQPSGAPPGPGHDDRSGTVETSDAISGDDDDEEEDDEDDEDDEEGDEDYEDYEEEDDDDDEIDEEEAILFFGQLGQESSDGEEPVVGPLSFFGQPILGILPTLNGMPDDEESDSSEAADDENTLGQFPIVPSDEGTKLMQSGHFGEDDSGRKSLTPKARDLREREMEIGSAKERRKLMNWTKQKMIPSTKAEMVIHHEDPVYSGQFSEDGNFFYSCGHDFRVNMYRTENPHEWSHYKTVKHPFGRWTLTDATLSPDNKWLAYTSLTRHVAFAPTDPDDTGESYTLDLGPEAAGLGLAESWQHSFGIFSIRFSGDGRELVAGTNNSHIIIYDIETRSVLHRVIGHTEDVNAVCFASTSSPHIFCSGSDDALVKVWDRRCLGDSREASTLLGHIEGITYIDSKGDGRYLLSNGKDSSMKLWDLRMAHSREKMQHIRVPRVPTFDYRWDPFPLRSFRTLRDDNSIVTFRGHKVLRTLIRCHFSPPGSSNSRYVYSGSHDGKVYIWNLDATLASTVDVRRATWDSMPNRANIHGWHTCVRDASWHPNAPLLVASAWNGYHMDQGSCSVHFYDEDGDDLEDDPDEPPRRCRLVNHKLDDLVSQ